jgi:predicted alpha/beta superfamily hydrolase
MKYLIPTGILIMLAWNLCHSQPGTGIHYTIGEYPGGPGKLLTIESVVLGEAREVYVGLPDHYNDSISYPVVLVLEGEVLFETIAPLTRLMAGVNEIPGCIVTGIPLNDRHLDYAPKISAYPESGNADRMLEFYRHELFPLLDSLYSISEDRIIWAHSALAGIFCTYLLIGPDNQFTGIISSSPNLRFMLPDYLEKDDLFDQLSKKGNLFYYLTFGGQETEDYMGAMYRQVDAFSKKLESGAPENLVWRYRINENNNHFTNAIETYMEGLISYFRHMR